jgi:hypothetical protein
MVMATMVTEIIDGESDNVVMTIIKIYFFFNLCMVRGVAGA